MDALYHRPGVFLSPSCCSASQSGCKMLARLRAHTARTPRGGPQKWLGVGCWDCETLWSAEQLAPGSGSEMHSPGPAAPAPGSRPSSGGALTSGAGERGAEQPESQPPGLPGLRGPRVKLDGEGPGEPPAQGGGSTPPGSAPFSLLRHLPQPPRLPPAPPGPGALPSKLRGPCQALSAGPEAPAPRPPAPKEGEADSLGCPLTPPLHGHRPAAARRLPSHFLLPAHTWPPPAPPRAVIGSSGESRFSGSRAPAGPGRIGRAA